MIYEGVNFNEPVIQKMTKEEFEECHLNILWLDRDEQTRKKMLAEVYGIIVKPKKKAGK
jgi:hypothetical protein